MLISLLATLFAQAAPAPTPQEVVRPQEVRALPGALDAVPVFNSNSPELVQTEGILLSTFPPEGKQHPAAHLNFSFNGRFDVFAHHVYRASSPDDLRSLYLGILVHNPGDRPVTIDILQAASYLSQPDAPFIALSSLVENPLGEVYAGPGSRVMDMILRGERQPDFPAQIQISAGETELLLNVPIPVAELDPPLNGRSTYMRLRSNGPVYIASLAQQATLDAAEPDDEASVEQAPTLAAWQTLLATGELSGARDRTPTPPDQTGGQIIYGRVAGVSQGSEWQAQLLDAPLSEDLEAQILTIPEPGGAFSYGISTLLAGRMGTEQNQSASMLVRYPDTAYQSHGNYGVQYSLTLPLVNPAAEPRRVAISLDTPIKEDDLLYGGLRFFDPLPPQIFFRGSVRVRYTDDNGFPMTRYVHLVEQRGQRGEPIVTLTLPETPPGGDRPPQVRLVQVDLLYPPDATPPQVLTVQTLDSE
jgi:hypothetical protein